MYILPHLIVTFSLLKVSKTGKYPTEEAKAMLEDKLKVAEDQKKILTEDLEFLRLQMTTMEVSTFFRFFKDYFGGTTLTTTALDMARVYNWDVKNRKKKDSK